MDDNKIALSNERGADSRYDEAIKTLRTNILFSGANTRVIMVTSAIPGEGKSSISFDLALSLAQMGKTVLFVDADIRKSVMVNRYHLNQEVNGLSQYLSGQNTLDEVLFKTNVLNLDTIFSGPFAPNPAELLEEPALESLLKWGKKNYDYVIVDTPPVESVIDGAIVAPKCDGVVLVIASGQTSYKLVQRVKLQLEKGNSRILGAVLNKVDTSRNGYYYGQYGYYKPYGAYGREEK